MKKLGPAAVVIALALTACGPAKDKGEPSEAAKAQARVIPPGPTGPAFASVGTIVAAEGSWVTLDHEGAADAGLAPGRTKFRTWGDIIAVSPGDPGARVAFKIQKLGEDWALVEMTAR